jgi:hypothetical protein
MALRVFETIPESPDRSALVSWKREELAAAQVSSLWAWAVVRKNSISGE